MPSKKEVEEGKLMAAMSYAMITAPIILFIEKKNKFARFHAKQATGLLLIFLIGRAIILSLPIIFWANFLFTIIIALFAAYPAVIAAQGKEVKLPFAYNIGDAIAKMFK